ncbi:MAG: beta galactosidase jelly roll domain-containing protein [Marinilabiliales bacterium]|nr:beta galactosidase jelly roll domain-containing protein [Marinilabiliales bacterium]
MLVILILLSAFWTKADVTLPPFFNCNMVLQQGIPIPVWGWASPGEKVSVTFNNKTVTTRTGKDGKWNVTLAPMNYGGPYKMLIKGNNQRTIENILIGEVWVCSGQSNMEFGLASALQAEAEIAASNYPEIRLFTVKKRIAKTPQENLEEGEWWECSPISSPRFSAVAYFFGRALYQKLKVPIGLIHTSWGGTVAETWTSPETIEKNPDFAKMLEALRKVDLNEYAKSVEKEIRDRLQEYATTDQGMNGEKAIWAEAEFNDQTWKTMPVPAYIEKNGLQGADGFFWFRKDFVADDLMAGKLATVELSKINDSDITWINGVRVGSTELKAEAKRVYTIPEGVLKAGKNNITVRVEDVGGNGGMYGDPQEMKITCGYKSIPLAGDWKYKIGLLKVNTSLGPNSYPTLLYNGMINPLIPYGIKGVIWYQGEGNAGRAYQYRKVFSDMILDWRKQWNQGDFPFLFVQLANFMKPDSVPSESSWAELREAQTMALELPKTGMASAIDVGDALDIHPKDKQTVGKRLALSALNVAYRQNIEYMGPVFKEMKITGNKAVLTFSHVANGLTIKDKYGYVKGFAIAGADHKFFWAKAKVTAPDTVEVSAMEVNQPVAVRYGWANNPDDVNLYNSVGLPADPFRTDKWKGVTE